MRFLRQAENKLRLIKGLVNTECKGVMNDKCVLLDNCWSDPKLNVLSQGVIYCPCLYANLQLTLYI